MNNEHYYSSQNIKIEKYACEHFDKKNIKGITSFIFNKDNLSKTKLNFVKDIIENIEKKLSESRSGITTLELRIKLDELAKYNLNKKGPHLEFVVLKDDPSIVFISKNEEVITSLIKYKDCCIETSEVICSYNQNIRAILKYYNIDLKQYNSDTPEILNFSNNGFILEKIFKNFALISEIQSEVSLDEKAYARLFTPLGYIDGLVSGSSFEFKDADLKTILEKFGVDFKEKTNISEEKILNYVAESLFKDFDR